MDNWQDMFWYPSRSICVQAQHSAAHFSSVKHGIACEQSSKAGSVSWNPFDKWYMCWKCLFQIYSLFTKSIFIAYFPHFLFVSFLAVSPVFGDHLWVKFSYARICTMAFKAFSWQYRYASTITSVVWSVCMCEVSEIHQGMHRSSFYGQAHMNLFAVVDIFFIFFTASFSTLVADFSLSSRWISAAWNAKITY